MKLITLTLELSTAQARQVLDLVGGESEVETKTSKKKASKPRDEEEEEDLDEEEEEAPKSKKSSKKASKKDEEEDEEEQDEDEEENEDEEEEEAPKSKKSAISEEQIITAFRDYSKKHDKEKAIKILNKEFKCKNVKDLKPSQYADVLKRLKGK